MSKLETILTYCPWLELLARRTYYLLKDKHMFAKIIKKAKTIESKRVLDDSISQEKKQASSKKLFEHIDSYGVTKGDILIVHSSASGLQNLDVNTNEVLSHLFEMVGEEGTLVLPTFPDLKKTEMVDGKEIPVYDVKRTVAWTGLIPNMFLRCKGTIRSVWPANTLAANGKEASSMFAEETRAIVSQGEHTAWNYCAEHHAKVLFLGVSPRHSLSEMHISEDVMYDEWPVMNWYEDTKYVRYIGKERAVITIKRRKTDWAKYVPEYNNLLTLKREGIIHTEVFEGLELGFIQDLFEFRQKKMEMAKKGKLGYRIPRRYMKHIGKD